MNIICHLATDVKKCCFPSLLLPYTTEMVVRMNGELKNKKALLISYATTAAVMVTYRIHKIIAIHIDLE